MLCSIYAIDATHYCIITNNVCDIIQVNYNFEDKTKDITTTFLIKGSPLDFITTRTTKQAIQKICQAIIDDFQYNVQEEQIGKIAEFETEHLPSYNNELTEFLLSNSIISKY